MIRRGAIRAREPGAHPMASSTIYRMTGRVVATIKDFPTMHRSTQI